MIHSLISLLVVSATNAAGLSAADHMTFKNNLLPGNFSIHHITRITRRKSPRRDYVEKLSYRQDAIWVQCNLNESRPGGIRIIQMINEEPAKTLSLYHDSEHIRPLPKAIYFNLSRGSTRLHDLFQSRRDAPFLAPQGNPAEQAVLYAMLDVAHWPAKKIDVGHRWQHDIQLGTFNGTQSFKFLDLVRVKDTVAARVRMMLRGTFQGELEKKYGSIKGQAVFLWSRLDRILLKYQGSVSYARHRPNGDESFDTSIDVDLTRRSTIDADGLDIIIDQLNLFAEADKKQRRGRNPEAIQLIQAFRGKWPRSIWLPAIESVEKRATHPERKTPRMGKRQLIKMLGKSLVAWEAARVNDEYDRADQIRKGLVQLAADYRRKLLEIAKKGEDKQRAQAVFALAFSENPNDFLFVQSRAKDRSSRVRGMALAGLAARGDPRTKIELLIRRLEDKNATVRARACQAIAACVTREHYAIGRVVGKLTQMMIHDDHAGVRREAILAIATTGAPADIPQLEDALSYELNMTNRKAIEKAIAKLKSLDR